MSHNIIGAVLAALAGFLVAFANYIFSKKLLVKAPEKYAFISVVRQILQVGFLIIVYFVSARIETVNIIYPLVGAVLGMTLPMIYFTKQILLVNDSMAKNKKEKEDETDG